VTRSFLDLFGSDPDVAGRAPGRVNLIGEHTDYNDGFVLPAALPLETVVELKRRADRRIRVWSTAFPNRDALTFDLDVARPAGDWADYIRAIIAVLRHHGVDAGMDLRVDSHVPVGGGLSSSAALLVAAARALREAFALTLTDLEIALLARRAENEFVGAPVGIMDQMACSLADQRSALLIDTQSLAYERVPIPAGAGLLVIDSGIHHAHASGDYRLRREECQRAAEALGVSSLRQITEADLVRIERLPPPLDGRARHVVTENARVLLTAAALRVADLTSVGRLFAASHASMRDDFQISLPEIDALVAAAGRAAGVYGARLTGGGFGGSIVAIVDPPRLQDAAATIIGAHYEYSALNPRVLVAISFQPPSAGEQEGASSP